MGDPQQAGLQGLGQVRDLLSLRLLRHEGIGEYTRDADAMQIEGEKQEATWTYQRIHAPAGLSLRDAHLPSGGVSGRKCLSGLRTYRGCQARGLLADLINALEAEGVVWAITGDQDRAGKEPRVARGCTPGPAPTLPFVGSSNGSYAASRICGENQISHGVAGQGPIEQKSALPVWGWHNQRGQAENFLKERKGGFDRMPGALLFPNRGDRLP